LIFCHKKNQIEFILLFASSIKMKSFVLVLLGIALMASSLEAAAVGLGNDLGFEAAPTVAGEAAELGEQAEDVKDVVSIVVNRGGKKEFLTLVVCT
jgi:hypothetical protein